MAILHAIPGQPVDVSPLGARLERGQSVALFKSRDLEVMRVVLAPGKSLPAHKLPGDLTLHCLEGRLEIGVQGQRTELLPGELVYLPGGVVHEVTAVEPSLLVTVGVVLPQSSVPSPLPTENCVVNPAAAEP